MFNRRYLLRSQLIHGGTTKNSRINRNQVSDGVAILAILMQMFVDVMMDTGEDWDRPFYPIVQWSSAPTDLVSCPGSGADR